MSEPLQGDALHPLVAAVATAEGVPFPLLLALAEAEAGRRADAARWHDPPRTQAAELAAQLDDRAEVARIVAEIVALGSDDMSWGCGQQTWRWSREYAARWGTSTGGRADVEGILACRRAYLDPRHALTVAAQTLAGLLARADVASAPDPWLRALYAYNRSAPGVWPTPSAQATYQRALAWARTVPIPSQEDTMADHSFDLGFKDLADELGADVVGEPVTDEFPIGDGPDSGVGATLQVTTQGVMVYASGAGARFLASQGA